MSSGKNPLSALLTDLRHFPSHRSLSPGPLVFKSFQLKIDLDRASFARDLLLCNDYS